MKQRSDLKSVQRDPLYKAAILYAASLALIIAIAVWVAYAQPPDPGFGDTIEMGRTLGGSYVRDLITYHVRSHIYSPGARDRRHQAPVVGY